MDNYEDKIEKAIQEAIAFYERGKTVSEILILLPEYADELKGVFEEIEALKSAGSRVLPNRALLAKIIEDVTKGVVAGYIGRRGEKLGGRPSIFTGVFSETQNMLNKWRILLPVGVVVILAIVFLSGQFGRQGVSDVATLDVSGDLDNIAMLNSELDEFLGTESALLEVDSSLGITGVSNAMAQDALDSAAIKKDTASVDADLNSLNNFVSGESGLKDVNTSF